jgi:hypothetical protein
MVFLIHNDSLCTNVVYRKKGNVYRDSRSGSWLGGLVFTQLLIRKKVFGGQGRGEQKTLKS